MSKLSARERTLLGLLAMGSIVVWLLFQGNSGRIEDLDGIANAETTQLGEPPLVRVELLASQADGFDPHGRNLFHYYHPPKPAAAPRGTMIAAAPIVEPPPAAPPGPPAPPVRPAQPEPTFTYIGFLGPKNDMIAVFNKGAEVFVAQIGDVVGDDFELLEFRYEAVILEYIGEKFNGKTTRLKKRSS